VSELIQALCFGRVCRVFDGDRRGPRLVVTRIITEGLFTIPPHDDSIQKMRVQLELAGLER